MKEKCILKVPKQSLLENFSRWFVNKMGNHKFYSLSKFYVDGSYNNVVYIRVIIPFGYINFFGTHVESRFKSRKTIYKFVSSLVDFKKKHIVMSFIKEDCMIIDSPTSFVRHYDTVDDLPF